MRSIYYLQICFFNCPALVNIREDFYVDNLFLRRYFMLEENFWFIILLKNSNLYNLQTSV